MEEPKNTYTIQPIEDQSFGYNGRLIPIFVSKINFNFETYPREYRRRIQTRVTPKAMLNYLHGCEGFEYNPEESLFLRKKDSSSIGVYRNILFHKPNFKLTLTTPKPTEPAQIINLDNLQTFLLTGRFQQ
jgi:hypothetical protein